MNEYIIFYYLLTPKKKSLNTMIPSPSDNKEDSTEPKLKYEYQIPKT